MIVKCVPAIRLGRAAAAGGILLAASVFGAATATSQDVPTARASAPVESVGGAVVRPMSELKIAATIPIGKTADWVAVTPKGVWIGSTGPNAVSEIDPQTNRVTTVELPGRPCAGITADSANVWVPLCGPVPKLAKVDTRKRALDRVFDVGPAGPEGGIAVGAGSVWIVVDKQGSLARIDPASGKVTETVHLPPGSYNPVFSAGRVWVSRVEGAELTAVDASTGNISNHVSVGPHPRFVTAGAGAVWTLNQGDGSLSRVDVADRRPVLSVPLDTPGAGGDVTYADGRVWSTLMGTPLTIVEAAKGRVLCQWKGAGGDSLGVGFGAVWLTNLKAGTVSRIPLNELPEDCRAGTAKR